MIMADERAGAAEGEVRCHERLGGLLRYHHRAAQVGRGTGRNHGALYAAYRGIRRIFTKELYGDVETTGHPS